MPEKNDTSKDKKPVNLKKEPIDEIMPEISCSASSMECTGLMPSMPQNDDEFESYQDIYGMEIPKLSDDE